MRITLYSILLFLTLLLGHAQVPVGQTQDTEAVPVSSEQSTESFAGGIFSDPSEIEMIEGLDDPLDVVKLRDHDANMILDMVQAITKRYILRPQNLPQLKINFDSMNILTKRETLLVLESLLAMNGVGITKIDSQFFKAVPASGMNVHVPIWIDGPANALPPSQRIYVKNFYLKYVPVEKMREILNPFATPNVSSLLIFPNTNSILITDSLVNLQRMEKIIEKTDYSKEDSSFHLQWYEPQRFSAEVLQSEFEGKYESFFKTDFHVKPEFVVPESDDQLGIYSHVLDASKILEIIQGMDKEKRNPIDSKLLPLYHASAESVSETLGEFLQTSNKGRSNFSPSKSSSPTAGKPGQSTQSVSSGVAAEFSFSPYAKVVADKRSNGIFMTGTAADLHTLEKYIKMLDTPLPMARIDTIFVMIDLTTSNVRGIDALFRDLEWNDAETEKFRDAEVPDYAYQDKIDPITKLPVLDPITGEREQELVQIGTKTEKVPYTVQADTFSGGLTIPGLNSGVEFELENWELKTIKWGQIFAAASERNDVRIFSTPSITVIHGGGEDDEKGGSKSSKIQIKEQRHFGTSSYYDYRSAPGADMTGDDANPLDGRISRQEAVTELVIENPRIRRTTYKEDNVTGKQVVEEEGTVFMSVEVTAEKFDQTTVNTYQGQELPTILSRYASTNLAIRDGQIMVLGGLQEVQLDTTVSKYNILSDIPYFGEKFFTPKSQKYTPTELLIFIRPSIIDPDRPEDDASEINKDRLDLTMEPQYTPTFVSPNGKILGVSRFMGDEGAKDKTSNPDERSSPPSF